jgi:hypothetical protein
MYCPNCGKKTEIDQRFCRACGLGLDKIAQSLGEQLPARVDDTLLARKERLEKLGVGALSVFGLGILVIVLYAASQKLITTGNLLSLLPLLGLFIMFGCGLASAILFALAKEAGEQAGKRQLQSSAPEKTISTRELLPEGRMEPVPTVTERTTELLFAEKRDNK